MEEFAAGTDVTLTIDHSYNGTALTLTDLQFRVVDAQGVVLLDYATPAGFNPANSSTNIAIDGSYNGSTEKVDIRQINVNFVTAAGTYKTTVFYKLLGDLTALTVMEDSFMTFPEAVLTRARMSDRLEWYDALTDDVKAIALENAFNTIKKLAFKPLTTTTDDPLYISTYTEANFRALSAEFQTALKRAQILQANALVEASPIRDKIREGIISETIGESSMFFKQTNVGNMPKFPGLSDDAYNAISSYLYTSSMSAQIWKVRRA